MIEQSETLHLKKASVPYSSGNDNTTQHFDLVLRLCMEIQFN